MRFLLILLMVLIYIAQNGALDYGFAAKSKTYDLQGALSFGISYDPTRERYAYIDSYNADPTNVVDMQSIDAEHAANNSNTDPDHRPKSFTAASVVPNTGITPYYGGEAIANDMLYVVDQYGYLEGINLETGSVTNYIEFGTYPNGEQLWLSSVCIGAAPDDTTMAYVPASDGNIYAVDIESNTVGGWVVSKILSSGDTILDQEGANPRTDFIAYDCAVEDEKVYFVETSGNGNLLIYDILNEAFSYNSIISTPARSITSIMGALVIAPEGDAANPTAVYATNIPLNGEAFMPFTQVATIDFALIYQIVADYMNDIVVVVGFRTDAQTAIGFIESYVTTATPTTAEPTTGAPTTEPTQEPTTMEPTTMKPTVYKSESMEPTTAAPTGPEDSDDSHAVNNFHNAAFIVMFVIICNTLLFA